MAQRRKPSRSKQTAGVPPRSEVAKGLDKVLAHAQDETRRQLQQAIEKKKRTGQRLMDILRQDVDREMFKRIWNFLQRPAGERSDDRPTAERRKVKDVLVEQGWLSSEEWEEPKVGGEEYDPEVGRLLVERGFVTQEQLQDALAQHQRSGQSVWRILINRGLVAPKQIADARKYGKTKSRASLDEHARMKLLLRTGLVTERQCQMALAKRKETGRDLFQVLIDSGVVSKRDLGPALAKQIGVPYVDLQQARLDPEAADLLPQHLAEQHRMIPIARSDNRVRLAMANPDDLAARELFRMMVNMEVEPVLAFEQDVLDAVKRHYSAGPTLGRKTMTAFERLKARLHGPPGADERMLSMAENVGVVNLVASIVEGAINSRATDIHLEAQTYGLRVRYRIDGMLYDIMNLPQQIQNEVLSRIKVLAGMDITERRHPQDGHFSIDVQEKKYDLRVATLPTVTGEKIVLRLLNPEDVFMGLRELGLESDQLKVLEDAVNQPYGMILVTGPIGSGKTTTLYAALSEIDIFTQNVVTIEDPVEYQLPGINQVQIDSRVHRTFANMLRSVVRQDADVMMVGEIRDEDTARVAVRAAMTGHLVFSTLHTNDAVGAIDTLRHLRIPPFLITSSLISVVAQRLVRKVCPACRRKRRPNKALLAAVGLTPQAARGITFYKAVGCEACYQSGYKGRTGIFEVLRMSDKVKGLILNEASHDQIVAAAREEGMMSLVECGVKKVRAGVTTLEEVLRVTRL